MTGFEIGALTAVLAAVALFLFLVRRASEKNQLPGGSARRDLPERRAAEKEEVEEVEEEPEVEEDEEEELGERDQDQDQVEPPEELEEEKLKEGLARTRGGFVARLGKLFARKKFDDDLLAELEEVLFTADIGPKTAEKLFSGIKSALSKSELGDPEAIWSQLREQSATILDVDAPPVDFDRSQPFVLLVLGVNGVGKTTTIGKVAAKLQRSGKKVLLAAGDTFRAAAVEQLEIWGDRAHAPVVKGKPGSDPSSVIFEAVKRGKEEGFDVVIADTAGRLHTKTNLMEELVKVRRVIGKAHEGAPHEIWLVLDATTGQNAIQQAQMFKEAMDFGGIVLTKLDGTAKGGVILGICDELKVPVRYIGIGEKIDDLRPFDARAFADALYQEGETADAA